ncbi:hypothetical protein FKR81_01505 [Lentzea tibetensis]|uniref:NTP pyrophosphohydrolase MazG putative catalytic core domain-containing protein n=1 Tax=Lentzea tibetensis TaxID=2591470 RepID=A0A563F2W3_9PSEU|nr:hypothetical protein [Lentzea tibetensis]TWP54259.1 hypothetical protein FKR81_01505 [Lentzea tibetensis]
MTNPLGPFQPIWDAWDEVDGEMKRKPLTHFREAVRIQFDELDAHLANGKRDAAAREVVDVISIALNCLRNLGYQPDEIADIARARAENRMRGQAAEILDSYQKRYGI